ncbi:hypothetical protein [Arthrobacter sp. NPDC057013]|uniref:hypothetical protein n=1 Tax=Arthrobacter sp. NPDC057013 TaxID=3345999 RepID=UPI0036425673
MKQTAADEVRSQDNKKVTATVNETVGAWRSHVSKGTLREWPPAPARSARPARRSHDAGRGRRPQPGNHDGERVGNETVRERSEQVNGGRAADTL